MAASIAPVDRPLAALKRALPTPPHTVITHGLATHLGNQTAYRLSYSELELTNDRLVEAYQVRSYLLERELGQSQLGLKVLTVDYYRQPLDSLGPAIREDEFFAMVDNNLAAEAWLAGKQDQAMADNQQVLQLQPVQGLLRIYLQRNDNKSAEDLLNQLVWQHQNSDKAQLYQTKLAGLRQLTRP